MIKNKFPEIYKRFLYVYEFLENQTMREEEKVKISILKDLAEKKKKLNDVV